MIMSTGSESLSSFIFNVQKYTLYKVEVQLIMFVKVYNYMVNIIIITHSFVITLWLDGCRIKNCRAMFVCLLYNLVLD